MSGFPQTANALDQWHSTMQYGLGIHTEHMPRVGVAGLYLGEVPFDPALHSPSDIDPLSLTGITTGELYVKETKPFRPFQLNIIVDATERADHPTVREKKLDTMNNLANDLADSLPGITDYVTMTTLVGHAQTKSLRPTRGDILRLRKGISIQNVVSDLTISGLSLVIGDYRRDILPAGNLTDVIAIKTNHPIERQIPKGVGFLSLGGLREINTNNSRQVDAENAQLAESHAAIVAGLRNRGASVAGVVLKPKLQRGYNPSEVDAEVAAAAEELLRKH